VLQEGYKGIWGADADHLKTYDDIDLMANAGYTMFTFDPSEFVDNSADSTDMDKIDQKLTMIDWEGLKATQQTLLPLYLRDSIDLENGISIPCNSDLVKRAFVKYGNAIAHIYRLYCHLSTEHAEKQYEIEISVDETESVTTPFEHFFFANELKRLGVEFVSLAPHFIGRFEKGIDYIGDLDEFKSVYQKHVAIINYFGTYKISLHSGSDKFSAYAVIGGINNAVTHVKTAGTSYLEALRVVASTKPKTFRSILDFSTEIYEDQKKTYHVSASVENIKQGSEYSDSELVELFRDNDVRQILHVAFGKVLTDKTEDGNYLFKNEIIDCLKQNEGLHYEFIKNHFVNHLKPFIQ
ncbi:MAG: tagaturonate epimerase family protein, partial [Melioribacteraceae bacterium]|nr:tagaturonate epimerase family protein [Melioribacteraceae bacterium]